MYEARGEAKGEAKGNVRAARAVTKAYTEMGEPRKKIIDRLCEDVEIDREVAAEAYDAYKHSGRKGLERVFGYVPRTDPV